MPISNLSFPHKTSPSIEQNLEIVHKKLHSVRNTTLVKFKAPYASKSRENKKIALEDNSLHLKESPLLRAIKRNDVEQLEYFFSYENRYSGAEKLNFRDEDGNTAVMHAVKKNDMKLLERLEKNFFSEKFLHRIPLDNELPDNNGNTPLMVAIKNGHKKMVAHLLSMEATNVYHKNNEGESAFTMVINDNELSLEIFKLVCDHTQLSAYDEQGRTLLMKTVIGGTVEKVKYALQGVDHLINQLDANGNSALALARRRGDKDIIKLVSDSIDNIKSSSIGSIDMDYEKDTDFHNHFVAHRGDFVFGLSEFRTEYLLRLNNASKDNFNIINYYTNRIARRIFLAEKNLAMLHSGFINTGGRKISPREIVHALEVFPDIYEAASANDDIEYPYAWREYNLIRDEIKKFDIKTMLVEVHDNYDKYDHYLHLAYSSRLGFRIPLFWKRSSKVGIEIIIRNSKRHLHFVLDGLDQQRITDKIEDSVTASELRYIYRNKEKLEGRLHFYHDYRRVPAPWTAGERFSGLWAAYIPTDKDTAAQRR